MKFQNVVPVSLISFGTVFCPHTHCVCALISDCAALRCGASSHVASSKMLTRICRRLLNSQSASCSAQIAGNSGSQVGVRVGVRVGVGVGVKASSASASHDKWQTSGCPLPHDPCTGTWVHFLSSLWLPLSLFK